MPTKSTTKKPASAATQPEPAAAKPSKSSVTPEQLEQAAKLRGEGATWNAIREATGARLGSSGWFRAWEREGIEHIPAGQRRAASEPSQPTAQGERKGKPAEGQSGQPSRARAATNGHRDAATPA